MRIHLSVGDEVFFCIGPETKSPSTSEDLQHRPALYFILRGRIARFGKVGGQVVYYVPEETHYAVPREHIALRAGDARILAAEMFEREWRLPKGTGIFAAQRFPIIE